MVLRESGHSVILYISRIFGTSVLGSARQLCYRSCSLSMAAGEHEIQIFIKQRACVYFFVKHKSDHGNESNEPQSVVSQSNELQSFVAQTISRL